MSKLKVKNFGPIKDGLGNEWIEIKKTTVFIGNQGSGKSTVAKLISTLSWIEKAINRGDIAKPGSINEFKKYFQYQNIQSYFNANTVIEYHGDCYSILYTPNNPTIVTKTISAGYMVPKIMYVPAERNFLSVIKVATGVRGLPEPLFEFAEELKRGQNEFKEKKIPLPINGVYYKYDKESETSFIIGKDFNVNLLIASSGFQSLVPLFLVSLSLAQITANGSRINPDNISVDQRIRMNAEINEALRSEKTTEEEKVIKFKEIKERYQNTVFINIVEEPEQNLFPSSQWEMLKKLLEFNNMNAGNKLIMTTHSPYLVNYISIAIQANYLKIKTNDTENSSELIAKMEQIISSKSVIAASDVVIYQLNETDGTIRRLPNPEGIPSDNNYLNQSLRHGNEMFDNLLEIEQEL